MRKHPLLLTGKGSFAPYARKRATHSRGKNHLKRRSFLPLHPNLLGYRLRRMLYGS